MSKQQPVTIELSQEQAEQWIEVGHVVTNPKGDIIESRTTPDYDPEKELQFLEEQAGEARAMVSFLEQTLCNSDHIDLQNDAVYGFKILLEEVQNKLRN